MKHSHPLRTIATATALFLIASLAQAQQVPRQDNRQAPRHETPAPNKELIQQAYQRVAEYNKGQQPLNKPVKVVYFYGNDQQPLPAYKERLNRVLNDVSDYYQAALSDYGIATKGIPFERKAGNVVFHLVKGDHNAKAYTPDSGAIIQREIYEKTKGEIDLSTGFTLVVTSLCYQKDDGTYVFHSPYFGSGSERSGLCMAVDCELLDPTYLRDTVTRMVFSEMAVNRKECLVAEFNSWYIGGIAHEMGHLFGLPHDFGRPYEFNPTHLSLMGQYGSRHFNDYLWNGAPTSVFSAASVMQLMSHPLMTGMTDTEDVQKTFTLTNTTTHTSQEGLRLHTHFKTNFPPYALVALLRLPTASEYYNRSYINTLTAPDSATIDFGQLSQGSYSIRLMYLFPNGSVTTQTKLMTVDYRGIATLQKDANNNGVDIEQFYQILQKTAKTPQEKRLCTILADVLHPSTPIAPCDYQGDTLYLSDAKWEKASVGYGTIARNHFNTESLNLLFLTLQKHIYEKGLYAHSPSTYVFKLNKQWKTLSTTFGIRDLAHIQGSARFTIIGDGKILYQSSPLRVNQKESTTLNISTITTLELKTEGTEGHSHNSWAIWTNPLLTK